MCQRYLNDFVKVRVKITRVKLEGYTGTSICLVVLVIRTICTGEDRTEVAGYTSGRST